MTNIVFSGGKGHSLAEAIIVEGAATYQDGIGAEYTWLEKAFGARGEQWRLTQQSLVEEGNRRYDCMQIQLRNGEVREIFFDITHFPPMFGGFLQSLGRLFRRRPKDNDDSRA